MQFDIDVEATNANEFDVESASRTYTSSLDAAAFPPVKDCSFVQPEGVESVPTPIHEIAIKHNSPTAGAPPKTQVTVVPPVMVEFEKKLPAL